MGGNETFFSIQKCPKTQYNRMNWPPKNGQDLQSDQTIHTTQAKQNKQGKLEHIEDNGFIFKKINKNENTKY